MKKQSKKQIKEQNKILRNFFIIVGALVLVVLAGYLFLDNLRNFNYNGVDFNVVSFCDAEPCLILYQTSFPAKITGGEIADYNFYLRNDPRNLKDVKFNGSMNLLNQMVVDSTGEFGCDGDGTIAMANFNNFYKFLGVNIFKNDSLKCDPNDKYNYVNIRSGNETRIDQTSWSCYEITVKNCEILKGTERYLLESFVDVNDLIFNK